MNARHYPVWEASYRPFGEEVNAQSTVNRNKFTGFERDSESGLDHTWFSDFRSPVDSIGVPTHNHRVGIPRLNLWGSVAFSNSRVWCRTQCGPHVWGQWNGDSKRMSAEMR